MPVGGVSPDLADTYYIHFIGSANPERPGSSPEHLRKSLNCVEAHLSLDLLHSQIVVEFPKAVAFQTYFRAAP
jgi:hypothetical protein